MGFLQQLAKRSNRSSANQNNQKIVKHIRVVKNKPLVYYLNPKNWF